jgi:hypothetical protein
VSRCASLFCIKRVTKAGQIRNLNFSCSIATNQSEENKFIFIRRTFFFCSSQNEQK